MIRFWYVLLVFNLLQLAWQAFRPDGPVLIGVVAIVLNVACCVLIIERMTPPRRK